MNEKFEYCNVNNTKDIEYLKAFAANLKKIREEKGLSQRVLAAKADISDSQIIRIETAKTNPTICTVKIIAQALGIEPKDLLDF